MNIRKAFAIILPVLLSASLSGACNNIRCSVSFVASENAAHIALEETDTDADLSELRPVYLKVWETDGSEKEFVMETAQRYMKENPNVTIAVEAVSHVESAARIRIYGASGQGADIFAAYHDRLGELLAGESIIENNKRGDYDKVMARAAISAASYEGTLYGYPASIETYALFYNKKLISCPPKTWKEVKEIAVSFNDAKEGKYAIAWDVSNAYFSYFFLSAFGADLFGPDGTDRSLHMINSPEAVSGLSEFQNFRRECLNMPAENLSSDFIDEGFKKGKIAMTITGVWNISDYRESGMEFGVSTIPLFEGGKTAPASFSAVKAFYVSAFSGEPEEARRFAGYLTSKESLIRRYEMTKQIPPRTDILTSDETVSGIMEQAFCSKPVPYIDAMEYYWPAMSSAFPAIWEGSDIKTELDRAAKAIEEEKW